VPIGVPGEVVIGGAGVARGYLDNAKTNDRFAPDQYASSFFKEKGWTTIHRTGDRGKLTADGGLVLLGRMDGDNQVKLRGMRINVEEIERAIVNSSAGAIAQAVVSVRSDSGLSADKFLVAFAVMAAADNSETTLEFLQRLARELSLPQHLRPAAIIPIETIPQNTSGKTDRAAVASIPIPSIASQIEKDDTLTASEQSLRKLWQQALPRELASYHSIDANSDFFHVGGSSLALVDLQALINDQLGVSMALYELFESSTLRAMAASIGNSAHPGQELEIDWETEVEVDPNLASSLPVSGIYSIPSGVKFVVLTGATGFLGKELLRRLLNDKDVVAIHCLAVRKESSGLPKIFSHPRVHLHKGNLGAAQLGLSDSQASSIFSCADIVIHNGADVSFMKSYQTLKLINVASTKELVKLALPRRIPFHFVSTAGVARLAMQDTFGEMSVASFPPPSPPNDGYIAAKWVSEVYLENIQKEFGMPVWIHRPSSITGIDAPELDLMNNVMKYIKETRKVPDSSSWTGVFDLISVESVASQIYEAIHKSDFTRSDAVKYTYESGEMQLGQEDIMPLMKMGTGQEFQAVSIDEWVTHAEQAGLSRLLAAYLRRASDGQVLLPKLTKGADRTESG
jgi:hybrid polyketide synthase/nonribosomal peptide synthetase ACE1